MMGAVCLVLYATLLIKLAVATPKKGLAIGPEPNYLCGDTNAFTDASWWYDWGYSQEEHKRENCTNKAHGEYVPMVHSERSLHNLVIPHYAKYVLGFNEPNVKTEANMSPQRTAELWPQVEKHAVGKKLISPAAAICYPNDGQICINWFKDFFAACPHCRVDALAVHSYGCDPNQVIRSMKAIHQQFNKKLWLTEFACHTAKSAEEQLRFLSKLQPWLEASPIIERYAWFQPRFYWNSTFINDSVDLLKKHSSSLTKLGEFYNKCKASNIIG